MRRWLFAALIGCAVLAAALVGASFLIPSADRITHADEPVPIGGGFTLVDQNGERKTEQDFRGRFMLVYFGYTFCPDMCPLGLQTITAALDALPTEQQERVVPVFITVDPERDTVAVMRDYVGQFHPRLIGLTGSEAEIADATRAWRVYASKAEPQNGGYLVDHSTFTYLMGPDGRYVAHFGHATTPDEMTQRIAEAIRAG
jgi:protein SCO1/2